MNAERIERMRDALQQALAPSVLEIEDDSHRHAGHAGARDGRARLATDFGAVGIKAEGQGNLKSGFAGILAATGFFDQRADRVVIVLIGKRRLFVE